MSGTELETGAAHAYFRAIEETFIRARGAPLQLSPDDWQLARRWFEAGIPLDLVLRTVEEVFARRKDRRARKRMLSLRYCRRPVENAWAEVRELTAAGRQVDAAPLEVAPRLAALAARLPAALGDRQLWAERITALDGESGEVEERLAALDRELLERLMAELDDAARRQLEERAAASLAAVATRLTAEELAEARERLRRQLLRQRLELPVLSLFAPEAEPEDPA